MTHEDLEDTIPLYAVGALERGERQAIEAHLLSGCVPCHSALKDYQSVAFVLPFGLNMTAPPHGLKATIMAARTSAALQETEAQQSEKPSLEPGEWMNHLFLPEIPSKHISSFRWVFGLAVAIVIAGGGYTTWTAYNTQVAADSARLAQVQDQAAAARSELATLQRQIDERDESLAQSREELERRAMEIVELKDQLIQREAELEVAIAQLTEQGTKPVRVPQDELAALLRTPNAKAIALSGTEMTKQASGMLLYDSRTQKAWLYTLNLPECPNGMTYQLWAIGEKPVSIGTFHVGAAETSHVFVKPFRDFMSAKTFSVSLEPDGGRPQLTGPVYLLSHS